MVEITPLKGSYHFLRRICFDVLYIPRTCIRLNRVNDLKMIYVDIKELCSIVLLTNQWYCFWNERSIYSDYRCQRSTVAYMSNEWRSTHYRVFPFGKPHAIPTFYEMKYRKRRMPPGRINTQDEDKSKSFPHLHYKQNRRWNLNVLFFNWTQCIFSTDAPY